MPVATIDTDGASADIAADATRRHLVLQNNNAEAVIYFRIGAAVTTGGASTAGVQIGPGGSYHVSGDLAALAVYAAVASGTASLTWDASTDSMFA